VLDRDRSEFFDRQRLIKWWDQSKLKRAKILVLGVGGIGTHVALGCCRSGIGALHLIDNDHVEPSNLNRQVLYSKTDINSRKVRVAEENLKQQHDLTTSIQAHNLDIFERWQDFISILEGVDVVMNGLDCPETKRLAVASACLKKEIPMIYAGTDTISGSSGMIIFQDSAQGPCYNCLQDTTSLVKQDYLSLLSPARILELDSIPIMELTKQHDTQPAATSFPAASIIAGLALSQLIKLLHDVPVPHRIICDILNLQLEQWFLERVANCRTCG